MTSDRAEGSGGGPPRRAAPRDRRAANRAAIEIPAQLRVGTRELPCTLRDVSLEGIALNIGENIAAGMVVQVAFRLPNSRQPLEVACAPVSSEGGRQRGVLGLRFVDPTPEVQRVIGTFVERNRSDLPFSRRPPARSVPAGGGREGAGEVLDDLYQRAVHEVGEKRDERRGLFARWRRRRD